MAEQLVDIRRRLEETAQLEFPLHPPQEWPDVSEWPEHVKARERFTTEVLEAKFHARLLERLPDALTKGTDVLACEAAREQLEAKIADTRARFEQGLQAPWLAVGAQWAEQNQLRQAAVEECHMQLEEAEELRRQREAAPVPPADCLAVRERKKQRDVLMQKIETAADTVAQLKKQLEQSQAMLRDAESERRTELERHAREQRRLDTKHEAVFAARAEHVRSLDVVLPDRHLATVSVSGDPLGVQSKLIILPASIDPMGGECCLGNTAPRRYTANVQPTHPQESRYILLEAGVDLKTLEAKGQLPASQPTPTPARGDSQSPSAGLLASPEPARSNPSGSPGNAVTPRPAGPVGASILECRASRSLIMARKVGPAELAHDIN